MQRRRRTVIHMVGDGAGDAGARSPDRVAYQTTGRLQVELRLQVVVELVINLDTAT